LAEGDTAFIGGPGSLFGGWVEPDEMIDSRACSRLTTLVQPQSGGHGGPYFQPSQPYTARNVSTEFLVDKDHIGGDAIAIGGADPIQRHLRAPASVAKVPGCY
jgi:hypothetical protein